MYLYKKFMFISYLLFYNFQIFIRERQRNRVHACIYNLYFSYLPICN